MATLHALERQVSKHSAVRSLRDEGQIPAIIYGRNMESKPVQISYADFTKTIRENGRNGIITLQVSDQKHSVILHDIQKDPLKSEIIHADFQVVDMLREVEIDVNIHLVGDAPGVKDGGVLQQSLHQLSIRVLPKNIPQAIEINVENLHVGDTISVHDVDTQGLFEINHEEDQVIASILPPKQEEEISSGEKQDAGEVDAAEGRET